MNIPPLRSLFLLLLGTSLALTSCQYPYSFYGYNDVGAFAPRRVTGSGILGDLSSSALGSNRDHYYYLIRGEKAGTRYYSTRPYYTGPVRRPTYPVTYQAHSYFSNPIHSSPYYNRSSSYQNSYTNRPWGGAYGFGQPLSYNSTGVGIGSRWF